MIDQLTIYHNKNKCYLNQIFPKTKLIYLRLDRRPLPLASSWYCANLPWLVYKINYIICKFTNVPLTHFIFTDRCTHAWPCMIAALDTLHIHTKLEPYRLTQSKTTFTQANFATYLLPGLKCTPECYNIASTPPSIPVAKTLPEIHKILH